jgi:serine protease Do
MFAIRKHLCHGWAAALFVALGFVLSVPAPALAQKKKDFQKKDFFAGDVLIKNNPKFLQAFRPAVVRAAESTVRIQCDGDDRALGVVVAENGFVLTQLHDLTGKVTVKLQDGTVKDATVVGAHRNHDLAMLKIDARGLKPISWQDSKMAPVGNWVASVGTGTDPVAVGVVSVAAREMPVSKFPPLPKPRANSGYLGIGLADDPVAKIGTVEPGGAAAKAGLKVGDVVLSVGGTETPDAETLIRTVQRFNAGDTIELKVRRAEEELTLKATLGKRPANIDRGEIQNNLGSKLSKLRTGYPNILQHDTVLEPTDCGSPLVDLDGRVVGINISRAGRVETYAIPAEVVRPLLADLMSGKLAPNKK